MLSITRLFIKMSQAMASADRVMQVIDVCDDMETLKAEYGIAAEEENIPHIEFQNVTFSYNGKCDNLKNISFALNKGESLGIIGATGSGKTTLISLLLRFYDAADGRVLINGEDVRSIPNDRLHQMFGTAFQNDMIFENTVYENISIGRNIDMDKVKRAAQLARIDEHIMTMEKGYMSDVAIRGANLSGGQKQRILIARALAGNPQILILDDSSSALDYKTDSAIRRGINDNYPDTTTIIIAQRISSIMNCDHIMVLDGGRMIGYGTHSELLESCEIYKEISDSQLAV
jgi:ATP-binding cassette subfamily B protein